MKKHKNKNQYIMLNGPRQSKYKKVKKGKLSKLEFKSTTLKFGLIGLKAAESGILHPKQIEAARQAISRKTKRKAKIWIRIFPDLPISSKPAGVRMGKGKGQLSHWGARVRGGNVLFEVYGVDLNLIVEALKIGGAKIPLKTKIFN